MSWLLDKSGAVYDRWKTLPLPLRVATAAAAAGMAATTLSGLVVGTLYVINPEYTRRKAADIAHSGLDAAARYLETGADKLPDTHYGKWNIKGSLSLTGPGIALGHEDVPVVAKADFGGGGLLYRFKPKQLISFFQRRKLLSEDRARLLRDMAPPDMYAGLELAPYPFAAGVLVDKHNAAETAMKLRRLQRRVRPYMTKT